MAEGPIYVILDMITVVIQNTIGTVFSLFGLSGNLLESLSLVSAAGGGLGLAIVLIIIAGVGFFVVKFLLRSMKLIGILVLAGLGILAFIFVGSAFV
ncbi:MAG: hypothetical protein JSV63_04005 [Candidatus Aenigmatarchaeota archaeon]|nr:MAG: hypothetical protein JSV63_04005 [Candidatus Aenigmarchaeota archaeon]